MIIYFFIINLKFTNQKKYAHYIFCNIKAFYLYSPFGLFSKMNNLLLYKEVLIVFLELTF